MNIVAKLQSKKDIKYDLKLRLHIIFIPNLDLDDALYTWYVHAQLQELGNYEFLGVNSADKTKCGSEITTVAPNYIKLSISSSLLSLPCQKG